MLGPEPTPLPFDLRGLEIFLAVCEAGGMSAGARRAGLTQPAASQAVAELEARLGTALFDRSVRPLALTVAGIMLRQRAATLLAEARHVESSLRDLRAGRLASVRVGLVDSLTRGGTPPLAAYLATVADQASFLAGLTASHVDALLARRLDLLLASDALTERDGLERWPLLQEPYVLALPRGAVAAASLGDQAAALPLIRFSARSTTGLDIERYLRRLGLDIPRRLEFDTSYGTTAAVAAGFGWAITTPLCLFESGLDLPIVCARLPGPDFTRMLTLVARRREMGRLPGEAARVVREALRAEVLPALAEQHPWLTESLLAKASIRAS